ncbi:MAG TPA: hypothetical protein VGP80_02035, partial [Gemmatimonadales bacterium]|nr:hypothetical protein [Gemmatimonadales bacterium]
GNGHCESRNPEQASVVAGCFSGEFDRCWWWFRLHGLSLTTSIREINVRLESDGQLRVVD